LLWFVVVVLSCFSLAAGGNEGKVIENEYVVVFHKNLSLALRENHVEQLREKFANSESGEKILHVYEIGDFSAYAAVLSPSSLQFELRNPYVRYIEPNKEVHLNDFVAMEDIQDGAPWGLDRIDQRQLPLDNLFHYFQSAGSNVDVYVIDTGIYLEHLEFGGRAVFGINIIDQDNTDCNGHGTSVAGVAGGRTYGVAKKATLVSVKTMGCSGSGTIAAVVAGINFVTKQYVDTQRPSVATLAIGASRNQLLDEAVKGSVAIGVNYAVPGGSAGADACNYSPSGIEEALVAASSTQDDRRSSYSSWGKCIDVFAPGDSIVTAYIGSINETRSFTGTTWPSAFVAGVVAVHLGENPTANPVQVKAWLDSVATPDLVVNPGSPETPNRLLYSPSIIRNEDEE